MMTLTSALSFGVAMYAGESVIAQIGDRRIMYAEVACNRASFSRHPARLEGRTIEEACRQAEQQKFVRLIAPILLSTACAVEGCALTDELIAPFRSPILSDESLLVRVATEGRRVPEAVRRVYRGEKIDLVYNEVIRPMNQTIDDFRAEIEMYGSLETVERYLDKDWIAMTRQSFEKRAREGAMRALVRKHIETAAGAANRNVEQFADEYLQSIAVRAGVEIKDERFLLPAGREVFK